ncbi:MAG: hypothetical protein JWN40_4501 [Phycisphaerales bacterium]|nr:hypothetical protein [Phycisphaerales bacterium]
MGHRSRAQAIGVSQLESACRRRGDKGGRAAVPRDHRAGNGRPSRARRKLGRRASAGRLPLRVGRSRGYQRTSRLVRSIVKRRSASAITWHGARTMQPVPWHSQSDQLVAGPIRVGRQCSSSQPWERPIGPSPVASTPSVKIISTNGRRL